MAVHYCQHQLGDQLEPRALSSTKLFSHLDSALSSRLAAINTEVRARPDILPEPRQFYGQLPNSPRARRMYERIMARQLLDEEQRGGLQPNEADDTAPTQELREYADDSESLDGTGEDMGLLCILLSAAVAAFLLLLVMAICSFLFFYTRFGSFSLQQKVATVVCLVLVVLLLLPLTCLATGAGLAALVRWCRRRP